MLKKKDRYMVTVVGATGAVGRELVELLDERGFPLEGLVPLASEESEGERIDCNNKAWIVRRLSEDAFKGVDIAFFFAGEGPSRKYAPLAVEAGVVVIDASAAFRMDPNVPLVVPDVNPRALARHAGVISIPCPSAAGMVSILKPIHDAARIRRVVATVFQSVSGDGKKAMDELADQTVALLNFKETPPCVYPHQIAFNCIPRVGDFSANGCSGEGLNIANETKKIFEDDSIRVTATSVIIPVFRCHSVVLNIEMERKTSANEVRALLSAEPGIVVYDDPSRNIYPMPLDAAGRDDIYVGCIREDDTVTCGISLWMVYDNLRRAVALNAVQIAEGLINETGLIPR